MDNLKPFLKWVGGKRQLLPQLKQYIPKSFERYYEPFVGGGALLFELRPERAVINDINEELINCYRVVQNLCNILLRSAFSNNGFHYENTENCYYDVRSWDRLVRWKDTPPTIKAARTIYLNHTCYNGLYRVNSKGQFNVPYGKYKNEFKPDIETLTAVSKYLNQPTITIRNMDFKEAVEDAREGDFVYFDPPYDPVSKTADFTAYNAGGFRKTDQEHLAQVCRILHQKKVNVMVSNSDTEFINSLYWDFNIHHIRAKRAINCNGEKRGNIGEVIITNYEDPNQLKMFEDVQ